MLTLAIDLGSRRVGLALGDSRSGLASPLQVLEVSSPDQASNLVSQIVAKAQIERLVVGLPLNMDNSAGPAARAAVQWGTKLSHQCNLPVIFVDERLSSFAADQSLIDQKRQGRKITRKQKKRRQDALAAADFLQAFLDGRLTAIDIRPIASE